MTDLAPFLAPVSGHHPPVAVIDDALAAVRRHLGMPLAYLAIFDGPDIVLRAVSSDHPSPGMTAGDRRPAEGSYCKAISDGRLPQLLPDTRQNAVAMTMPVTLMTPVGSIIAVPLALPDGTICGMVCAQSPDPMPALNQRDLAVVQSFARRVEEAMGAAFSADHAGTSLRRRIDDVIADRDFQLLLQPIVALSDNAVMGAEALCRFRPAPYRSPDTWFAEARQVGLHLDLEWAVIAKITALLPDLPRALNLSINVSPDMLAAGDLPDLIDGPFSDRIIFELTDHDQTGNLPALQTQMRRLRRLGVQIAVDDLTPGYASLNTVLQIKPDIVKLDREIVRGINLDPANRALAAAVVHFADDIGAQVIAEGIERQEEATTLRDLGVMHGQGFLLGRPGGLTALEARIYTQ